MAGIPSPKDVLGYHVGAPAKLTYYADILKYYRALAAATPRVKVETIGKSDEDRELVVVWVSSDANIKNLQQNRDNLAKIADPRGLTDAQIKQLIATTKPHYHLMGGLHSGETGPSEMLMELVYRLATETSPFISQIRDNVYRVGHAGGRRRRTRSQRRLVLSRPGNGADRAARQAAAAAGAARRRRSWRRWRRRCRTGASTSIHDNNRDINLSQMSMRAITDWYFTAHPPIMHDLHEAQPLMYTYSGGPPQNPNLDPMLFAELPFFANWELAQMTKWGMPGVYTHAFMDGWSPGYLGSVAYNHNGMMRMYETQSGRDMAAPASAPAADARCARGRAPVRRAQAARGCRGGWRRCRGRRWPRCWRRRWSWRRRRRRGWRRCAAAGQAPPRHAAPADAPAGAGAWRRWTAAAGSNGTGRGGGQDREWYRGIPIPPGAQANFTRRNNTNYMETGVLSALQLTSMFPNLVLENFYMKTQQLDRAGHEAGAVRLRDSGAARHDASRPSSCASCARRASKSARANAEFKIGDATYPGGLVRDQGRPAVLAPREEPAREAGLSRPALTTYDDSGWTMGYAFNVDVKEINDKAILDAPTTLVKSDGAQGQGRRHGHAPAIAVAHYGSNNMIAFRYS